MALTPNFQSWLEAQRALGMTSVRIPGLMPGQLTVISLGPAGIECFPSAPSEEVQRAILDAEQAIADGKFTVVGDFNTTHSATAAA